MGWRENVCSKIKLNGTKFRKTLSRPLAGDPLSGRYSYSNERFFLRAPKTQAPPGCARSSTSGSRKAGKIFPVGSESHLFGPPAQFLVLLPAHHPSLRCRFRLVQAIVELPFLLIRHEHHAENFILFLKCLLPRLWRVRGSRVTLGQCAIQPTTENDCPGDGHEYVCSHKAPPCALWISAFIYSP